MNLKTFMLGLLLIGLAQFSSRASASTCYEDGEATCEELAGLVGVDCSSFECFKVQTLGWFCSETETNILSTTVNVAVHVDLGQESFSTGATVNCRKDRRCKGYCGYPGEGEVLYCESGTADLVIDPEGSFAHTYATGNYCDPY